MEAIRFPNVQINMAGNLYFPESFDNQRRYPAIVVIHPSGGVKEQTAGLYAEKLAQHGFVTLAFDSSCQGESGGEPRYEENPYTRVADISAAIDYLVTQPFIHSQRIGVLGVCAGGGYAIHASMVDRRIQATGTISAVNYGAMYRKGWAGDQVPEQCFAFLEMAAQQRNAEAKGAPIGYTPTVPMTIEEVPNQDFAEAFEYYRTPRAMHPNSPAKITTRSLAQLVTYDAFNNAEIFLTRPLLVIAGSEAGTRWLTEEIYQRAASVNKRMHIVEGATHIALYDQPQYVAEALSKLVPFFTASLPE